MIKRLISILMTIFLLAVPAFSAEYNELETAIIQQDYQLSKKLASDLLTQNLATEEAQQIRFYLGLSHLRLREYDQAKAVFKGLIAESADLKIRDRAYLGLFNSYYLNEEYKEADQTINTLMEISPHSPFLSLMYLKAARVNLKLTNWRKAQDYLKKIINQFPNSLEIHTARQLLEERQYFAVQIGAFLDRKLAESQVNELRQKNEYAYIVETTDKDNRTFYRVRVGQMTLLDDARVLKSRLSKQGYPTEIYP